MAEHLRGRIETFALADLLQWLEVKRASGRLTLGRGDDIKTIDWKDGDIVYVSGTRPADRLGHALAVSREIPLPDLYRVLARNFAGRTNLTRLFFEERLISKERLASIVEHLARRLLREALSWPQGRFDFDPDYKTEDLLQIHLRLKSQVVAFEAARDLDDSARRRSPVAEAAERPGDSWERSFRLEEVDDAFWEILLRLEGTTPEAEKLKGQYYQFRELAQVLHGQLSARSTFLPIYEDSAHFAADLLSLGDASSATVERLLGIIHLDPQFTLNLLHLADSLAVRSSDAVGNARLALQKIGFEAFRSLVECLSDRSSPHLSTAQPIQRALRRAALSAAITAQSLAPAFGADPEDAYAAGLLHAVAYTDLLEAAHAVQLPPGPFRAAALEYFRPFVGKIRAAARGLPETLTRVLADDGKGAGGPVAEAVRAARGVFPGCAVGPIPPGSAREPGAETRSEVAQVFEFLDLGKP